MRQGGIRTTCRDWRPPDTQDCGNKITDVDGWSYSASAAHRSQDPYQLPAGRAARQRTWSRRLGPSQRGANRPRQQSVGAQTQSDLLICDGLTLHKWSWCGVCSTHGQRVSSPAANQERPEPRNQLWPTDVCVRTVSTHAVLVPAPGEETPA